MAKVAPVCIPAYLVDEIKKLNLGEMNSAQRIEAFDSITGNGSDLNLLYEKSLLLKNKQLDSFIDNISGKSLEKKAKIKENIAKRIAERQGIVDDEELLSIAKESLDRKYGLDIDIKDTEELFRLRKEADELSKSAIGTPDGSEAKLKWGEKLVDLSDKIAELKNPTDGNIFKQIGRSLSESRSKIARQEGVLGKAGQTIVEVVESVLGLPAKGIKAAWDASYIFRQGLKVLTADKAIWANRTKGSLKSWTKLLDKDVMEEVARGFKADLVTRDLYQDAIKSKLAIGVIEDFFPTNIAEKIPALGNVFKASDDSFTMFSQGSRMDLFEKYVGDYVAKNGKKPPKEVLDSMASYVNGLTGRGGLAKAEAVSGWLNQLFFSARYQVANLKTFTDPLLAKTPEVRKIAAQNLARHAAVIFSTMTALSAITDVGFDPRESTFGKARIPGSKKWVDITGGLGSYFSLLGKMYKANSTKDSFGKQSALDILVDFSKGKLAPVPGAIRDYLEQKDYSGEKPTAGSTLESLFVPITIGNIVENKKDEEEAYVQGLSALFDIIGAGVSQPRSGGSYGSPLDLIRGK